MTPEEFKPPPSQDRELLPVQAEQLPPELLAYRQWVCWRYVDRGAQRKPDKQPVNPRTLGNAGVQWANTWSSFEQAYDVYQAQGLAGIGFVLTQDDPFVGVDVDHCIADGEIATPALEVVQHLASYTEISPSGRGLRILVQCADYHENRRTPALEVYAHSRFLTLTGRHVEGAPATTTIVVADNLHRLVPHKVSDGRDHPVEPQDLRTGAVDTLQLWERIFRQDRYGAEHLRRFQGDTSPDGNDHSLTVLRLLNALARWTHGDATQMRNMMLMSPLANDKWFSKRGHQDWLDYQIANAILYTRGRK